MRLRESGHWRIPWSRCKPGPPASARAPAPGRRLRERPKGPETATGAYLRRDSANIETDLKRGDFVFRYAEPDDYGPPANAFVASSFWYANALAAVGRADHARATFERLLACRNRHGLLAEHIDAATGEHWGNFVQTASMVGLVTTAARLSTPWYRAL